MKSRNVCAIDVATIADATINIVNPVDNPVMDPRRCENTGDRPRSMMATLFTWSPGMSPVKTPNNVPAMAPRTTRMMISIK
jgi:hypothetical protein